MDAILNTTRSLLRAYASVLFSRSLVVGALVLAATLTAPRAGALGLVAVASANSAALLFGLRAEAVEDGSYGYNALLFGLGAGHLLGPGAPAFAVAVLGALGSVIVTAAHESTLGHWLHLPSLSAPFIAAYHLLTASAPYLGAPPAAPAVHASPAVSLPSGAALFVESLGALFFAPGLAAGALVLLALLVHSRIATSLAAAGFAVSVAMASRVFSVPDAALPGIGLNAALVAVGLGAVWFVPSPQAFGVALAGACLSTAVFMGLSVPLARVGLPVLIVPFHLVATAVLLAMRRRLADDRPKSVDFLPGTPEENLAYHRTRRARFGALYATSFRLPFRGTWTCTQAVDGAFTHKGVFRHAFDFQVLGEDGEPFRGDGLSPADFHCHRLPVLAAASGTVVKVESRLPDSAVGEVNVKEPWGNHVIVHHAPGLYSVVAHLAPGSVKVAVGQIVLPGDVLGLAGASGRSPEPHLHFQLQATPEIGAPTLPCRFSDVVITGEGGQIQSATAPREGQSLRHLEIDSDVAACLSFTQGQEMAFVVNGEIERLVTEVDVLGRFSIRSKDRACTLFHARSDAAFTAVDLVGDPRSALALFRAALSRVPFELESGLTWTDTLPARGYRAWPLRVLADFVSPFLANDGIELSFSGRREGRTWVLSGASKQRDGRGEPVVRSTAVLAPGAGPLRLEVTVRGRKLVAERAPHRDAEGEGRALAVRAPEAERQPG